MVLILKNQVMFGLRRMMERAAETTETSRELIHRTISTFSQPELAKTPFVESLTDRIKRFRKAKHLIFSSEHTVFPLLCVIYHERKFFTI
jgi:hypothetical protein